MLRAHIHISPRLVRVVYTQPAAFVAVTSKVYPDLLFSPLTGIVPVFDHVSSVDAFTPSFAEEAVNDVHGDSLDDAVKSTLALRAPRRVALAFTVNGRHPHVAYSVSDAANGYDAPSAYAVPFPLADVSHRLNS